MLLSSLASGAAMFSGCVSSSSQSSTQLVWGRRGFSEGRFIKPRAITISPDDELFVVDTTGRIQVFDVDGNYRRGWKTPETENGRPTGLAIQASAGPDATSNLLVADTHYYRTLTYTLEGELRVEKQLGGTSGHAPGEFAFVTDAVCDEQGCFYIGEYGDSDRIQKFDPNRNFLTQWGGTGDQHGQFVRPQSLVVHEQVLWVADSCNHRIQCFDIREEKPRLIKVIGREGNAPGEFYYPYDLAFASDGTLVVCEFGNQRLQRLEPDGKWIASWGGPGFQPGQLYDPWGIVVDSKDRVHVLDSNNNRVQRLALFS
ncbi:NHL repeat protein [Novipirellula galeiformis]|uniref:NHL repeat protein n=2 Tax=Novipirellula galeiformis TaxID=2528004 RepID=A0A5C6CD49_9BACT|nr:NHL repeat protein [Novipirellula galeiformis]